MTSGNNIESEYLDINAKNEWPVIYQRIRSESSKDSCTEAIKPQNKSLNRYRDVSPFDHSRIILKRGASDYINANLIKIEKANRQYILTQGPLANTVSHFWLMVWEQRSKAILMLNKLIEKKQEKCYQYWPQIGPDHLLTLADVGLTVEYVKQHDHSYYLTREFRLTDTETGESRDIVQFHYITWPDFGVPGSPTAFLEFLRRVRSANVLEPTVGPAIVHCSAGIGRSGTFCLVDSCLVLIEKFGLNSVDVKEILLEMRKYRMGLIQTPEQLRFSYQAIIEGAKQLLDPNAEDPEIVESHEDIVSEGASSSDEEPPPPPPRGESLEKKVVNGGFVSIEERPLPKIPASESCDDLELGNGIDDRIPSGKLPDVPSEEDELSSEDEIGPDSHSEDEQRAESPASEKSDDSNLSNSISPSELRHRNRVERKEKIEAKVRDMKRRQQMNEQWTQLKRPKTTLQD
ncbi:tyrosine-protein phosphatase non-receptor type 61F isoform X2 [Aethina tumida]|uniref:tyrosine-protein phosphatase non-receptor type 61F isoform X2 n=1 Tax=Aethina tumida TaxID=116153 RepID=UPI00096B3D82|nr:tyrosine-protein phosphatase non-receptor type 61F isoform X2 [Aethina tumida]